MKHIYLVATALAVSASALADTPAEERAFDEFAASGCQNRNGDFIIRGVVSSANEGTFVLADPTNSRITTSVALPGGGGGNREATDQTLSQLRTRGTAVVVTLECKGDATPLAKHVSYVNPDGTHSAISF